MKTKDRKIMAAAAIMAVTTVFSGCVTDMGDHGSTESPYISFGKLDVAGETSEPAGWANVPSANFAPKAKSDGNNNLTVQVDDFFTPRRDSVCIWDSLPTMTRGSRITSGASVTNIGVSAAVYPSGGTYTSYGLGSYFYNQQVTLGVNTPYYWPADGYKLSFFAYYPYGDSNYRLTSSAATTGSPTYTVSVPSAIADQKDFMTAQLTDRSSSVHTPVELTFGHRMAAIRINYSNERSTAVTVKSISIEGVYYNGTYNSSTWTTTGSVNSGESNPFTLTLNREIAAETSEVDLTGTDNIYFMIPQTLPSGAKIKVEVDDETFEANLEGSWASGMTYTYTIIQSEDFIELNWLKFTALETGSFTLTIGSNVSTSLLSSVSYSIDNGSTWTTTNNVDGTTVTITTPTIAAGNTVLWKGIGTAMASGTDSTIKTSIFSSTGRFEASGNIMSLLYGNNFTNKKSLSTNAYAFSDLFYFNGYLVSVDDLELPATTLGDYCYSYMFHGCNGFTTAPALPATTLADFCYYGMFSQCDNMTTAPALPATTLTDFCYCKMFLMCKKLTTAPELPATTLTESCYDNMFSSCTGLKSLPSGLLPATTLTSSCYRSMFAGCSALTTAPALPATTLAENCYYSMFNNCKGLTAAPALPATTLAPSCYYQMFYNCTSLTSIPSDLLPATTLAPSCYCQMFYNCTSLTSIPSDLLPATTLTSSCYYSMFSSCKGLTSIPSDLLPATTLTSSCYRSMFAGCSALTTAPALPATTLAGNCYYSMFSSCKGLTAAPALPATTLASSCYRSMFSSCTGLTSAPVLPATTLASSCYREMFKGCTNLNEITCLATDISATNCTTGWVTNVASSGTFICREGVAYTVGNNGIPSGWSTSYITD